MLTTRKLVFICAIAVLCLTGCGSSGEKHSLIGELSEDFDWVTERQPSMFPEGMTNDGREIFGDGRDENVNDIFTQIERKIWGDD